MSISKLSRRLARTRVCDRIKLHAQREAVEAIEAGRWEWSAAGARKAREAMERVLIPAVDEYDNRPTYLTDPPEHPMLMVPIHGRRFASFASADLRREFSFVVRFEYRPMAMRIMDHTILWWDLVPESPVRDRQSLVDEVLGGSSPPTHAGPHLLAGPHLADKLDYLVARMRLVVRETEHAERAER